MKRKHQKTNNSQSKRTYGIRVAVRIRTKWLHIPSSSVHKRTQRGLIILYFSLCGSSATQWVACFMVSNDKTVCQWLCLDSFCVVVCPIGGVYDFSIVSLTRFWRIRFSFISIWFALWCCGHLNVRIGTDSTSIFPKKIESTSDPSEGGSEFHR